MEIERRAADRRQDPDAWSPEYKREVRTVYGMVVGGFLIGTSSLLLAWAVITEQTAIPIYVACGVTLIFGLIASMPGTFVPVTSDLLKKIPSRNGKGKQ